MESQQVEAQESSGETSYVDLFTKRMKAIKPIHESESLLSAYDFGEVGIKDVKKLAPALILEMENGEMEMWLGEPSDILLSSPISIHNELEKKMWQSVDEKKLKPPVGTGMSAFVLQDKNGTLHLFFEEAATRSAELDIDKGNEERKWARFVLKYGIGDLFGTNFMMLGQKVADKSAPVHNLLDLGTMAKLRKNLILAKISDLEALNSTQTCRFWAYAMAADPPIETFTYHKAFEFATGREMKRDTEDKIFGERKK